LYFFSLKPDKFGPAAYYVTGNNYMLVEIKTSTGWQTIATDSDRATTVRWRKEGKSFIVELSWQTTVNLKAGEYRRS